MHVHVHVDGADLSLIGVVVKEAKVTSHYGHTLAVEGDGDGLKPEARAASRLGRRENPAQFPPEDRRRERSTGSYRAARALSWGDECSPC